MEKQEAIIYIRQVLEKQEQLENLNQAVRDTEAALDKAQRALETYKVRISEESAQIVKKEREALEIRLRKSVQTAARRVERAEKKRSQEKDRQQKSHAADATQEYKDRIDQEKSRIKTEIKRDGIPFYCNSSIWFSLFMPAFLTDYLILFAAWLVMSTGLPMLIYVLVPDHKSWQFFIIFPLFVVATIILYIQISGKTRKKYRDTLKQCRERVNLIHELKGRIRKTKKQIYRSSDESPYELKELDEKIQQARRDLEIARNNQADGLKEFEQHTRIDIIEEFRIKSQEKLEELTDSISQLTRQKNLTMEMTSELQLELIDGYEDQLGAENINPDRLKQILFLLESGGADTLESAVAAVKAGTDPE